jgi:hypothetical protein
LFLWAYAHYKTYDKVESSVARVATNAPATARKNATVVYSIDKHCGHRYFVRKSNKHKEKERQTT